MISDILSINAYCYIIYLCRSAKTSQTSPGTTGVRKVHCAAETESTNGPYADLLRVAVVAHKLELLTEFTGIMHWLDHLCVGGLSVAVGVA